MLKFFGLLLGSTLLASCVQNIGAGRLHCRYEMNACGDCAAQYLVDSTYSETLSSLKGEVIEIVHSTPDGEVDISQGIMKCLICYEFIVEGRVERSSKGYKMIADTVVKRLSPNCCTDQDLP